VIDEENEGEKTFIKCVFPESNSQAFSYLANGKKTKSDEEFPSQNT
jgi:hypothetical protein